MNPSDLRSKLDSIKKRSTPSDSGKIKSEKIPESEISLLENGWQRISDMVFEKIEFSENPLPAMISDFLMADSAEASSLIFYDTETTGLSGGAGNLVFLAGFGFIENKRFKTVQIMLSDFPGEPSFLEAVNKYIDTDHIFVSYNGRSFDSNILKSRFAMKGMKIDFGYQLDLLYPSRRLWKNIIGSCSLGDIEREILHKKRILDVPGAMVPDLYFDFIRTGKYSFIEGVVSHHLEDIKSLAHLLSVFENIFKYPLLYEKSDRTGLSFLLMNQYQDKAVEVLKKGMEEGSYQAAKELGLYYKRNRSYNQAFDIWNSMWKRSNSLFAGIELAKYYEHRLKDPYKALKVTEELLSLEKIRIRSLITELDKRKRRLEKKLIKDI